MRYLCGLLCVCALGVMPLVGCGENGNGPGGSGGTAGDGGSGGAGPAGCDGELCQGVDCDDADPCTKDVCNVADGTCSHVAACDDFNDCTTETCDPGNESCSTPTPVTDGTSCAGGTCQSGACVLGGTVLPCTEQGIRNAIAAGDATYTFDCDGTAPVATKAEIVIDNDVILDGEGNLTVDGNCDHTLFSVSEGVTAELRRLTVTRGYAFRGGGIRNEGTLTLNSSNVTRCSTSPSGLMVSAEGGGIISPGTLTVLDSTISGNAADFGGGGIQIGGSGTLMNSIVSGNAPEGIRNWGTMTINDSTVSGNTGDGVHNRQRSTITIANSTVSENTGNGVYTQIGTLTVTNSTVSGNADHAIYSNASDVRLTHSTVSGSVYAKSSGYPDVVYSIEMDATVIDGTCILVGTHEPWTSNGYNIESPGNTCGFDQEGDQSGVSAEALDLQPLADNGGPTQTHAITIDSAAFNAGTCEVETDQRGVDRPQGTMCDVGAFELEVAP